MFLFRLIFPYHCHDFYARPSCGHQAGECSFWSEVIALWTKRVGQKEVKVYSALVRKVERSIRGELFHRRRRTIPEVERYAHLTYGLYDCIRLCSGRQIVVDASKRRKRETMGERIDQTGADSLVWRPWKLRAARQPKKNPRTKRFDPSSIPSGASPIYGYFCSP